MFALYRLARRAGEKAEKLDAKEKKPETKKVDPGAKVKKGNIKARMRKKRKPTTVETLS